MKYSNATRSQARPSTSQGKSFGGSNPSNAYAYQTEFSRKMSSPKTSGEMTQKAMRDVKRKSTSGLGTASMTKVHTLNNPRQSLQVNSAVNSSKNSFMSTQKSLRPGGSRGEVADRRYKKENQTSKKKDATGPNLAANAHPTLA